MFPRVSLRTFEHFVEVAPTDRGRQCPGVAAPVVTLLDVRPASGALCRLPEAHSHPNETAAGPLRSGCLALK